MRVVLVGLLLLSSGIGASVTLVEHAPAHGGDDDTAGELDDRQGDAEEIQDGETEELDDGEKDDVIDGNSASQMAIYRGWGIADEAEEDKGRAERIDKRQERAEGDQKRMEKGQSCSPSLILAV